MEQLHAVVAGVDHGYAVARGGVGNARRAMLELPVGGSPLPELAGERAVRVEQLHADVAGVGHGYAVALGGVGDVIRAMLELPVGGSPRAELEGKGAVRVEHLNAVVGAVGHRKHAVPQRVRRRQRRICNRTGVFKLVAAGAVRAELAVVRAVWMKELHAVVVAVGHGYAAA